MNCEYCQQVLAEHFCVTRVGVDGKETLSVRVCSMLCLLRWSYMYSGVQARRGVNAVQNAVQKFFDALSGPAPRRRL
jgi:hypothetical protein